MPESFQEWLAKAKEDPKVAAQPVIVFIALLVLAYKSFYSPQKILLTKALKENKNVENQIRELESAVANIDDLQLEVNGFRKAFSEAEAICYRKSEVPIFFQDLRRLGKQAGFELKSINPMPSVPKTFETLNYEELSVKIAFLGTLQQLGIFLRGLENNNKLIFLSLPDLTPDASGTFKCDLLPTAIILPDPPPPQAPPPNP